MQAGQHILYSTHNAAYWAQVTKATNFTVAEAVDANNRIFWKGLMGAKPYPVVPTGLDLRANRDQLLKLYQASRFHGSDRRPEHAAKKGSSGE